MILTLFFLDLEQGTGCFQASRTGGNAWIGYPAFYFFPDSVLAELTPVSEMAFGKSTFATIEY